MAAPALLAPAQTALAQQLDRDEPIEEILVTGIRPSLQNALAEKRQADNLVELIMAEDIGKLPDQNLAEVLENVTGIQITREAGVGTGVQIRGTNANRTEINGVSTVGSGAGRSGIDFEDVSAAIIAAVEVTKAPDAGTIEGSVGGTINLRTLRPLDLRQSLAVLRVQNEDSSLTTDSGLFPRISGTWGDRWQADNGDWGLVISASHSQQDVSAFRPRTDRDNSVASDSGAASAQSFHFLPIQFLLQDYDNFEYTTTNISGTLEWAPHDGLRLYADLVINDQERLQESSRMQASGVSSLKDASVPTAFERVDFGSLGGRDLGSIQAALTGVIGVDASVDDDDPNLRFSGDTGSRITESQMLRLGGDWQIHPLLSARLEYSSSTSDTTSPSLNTTLNFINPNVPEDPGGANDNSTPFRYDLRGGALTWGVAFDETGAPTVAQLLDPANVVLRDVNVGRDIAENSETALVADFHYNLDMGGITSVEFGYRYNNTSSLNNDIRSNRGLRSLSDSPSGDLFASVLVRGPDNFDAADGRALAVRNFLLIDPELAISDPDRVLRVLNDAITAHGGTRSISQPTSTSAAFFDISETTHALWGQANFESGIWRGNFGLRFVQTDVESVGNSVLNDMVTRTTNKGDYSFALPRLNLVAELRDDVNLRAAYAVDIRRPDFDDLSTSFSYSTSPNPPVAIGNPGLEPEEVTSFDLALEWYFAPGSVASIGYFNKKRTNLHVTQQDDPFEDPDTGYRDLTDPCEGGGVFNPIADPNVFAPTGTQPGICVPSSTTINDPGETAQTGYELAFQYDLAGFEEQLGWASGFGVVANYTIQEFSGGLAVDSSTSRASAVFALSAGIPLNDEGEPTAVSARQSLIDLSETSYNLTLYYEKHGVSARMRYTWREAYRSTDFGSTSSFPWGFPVVQGDRGQLNASVNYDVNDSLGIGLEIINLTESKVEQHCINEGALLCYQGLTDRRTTIGASYRF